MASLFGTFLERSRPSLGGLAVSAAQRTFNMRQFRPVLLLGVTAVWLAGCSSSTESVTSPSTSKCAVSITATPTSFAATGGTGTLDVSTTRDCQWTAKTTGGWIQLTDPIAGQGAASRSFSLTNNPDPIVRNGEITVGDQQIAVTQEAAACKFTMDPIRDAVSAAGGQSVIAVTASSPKCAWTARAGVEWLTVLDGAQTTGSGQVRYGAQPSTGPSRQGTLVIAGQEVVITEGSGCRYTLQPGSLDVGQQGGPGTFAVGTVVGCAWTAASSSP